MLTTITGLYWSAGAVVEPSVYHLNVVHESLNAVGTSKTNFVYTSDQLKISIDYLVNFSQNMDIQNTVKKMTTLMDSKLSPSEIQVKIKPLVNDFNIEYESAIEKDNWYHRLLFKLFLFLLLSFIVNGLIKIPPEEFIEEIISPESEVSSWETVSNSSQESDQ